MHRRNEDTSRLRPSVSRTSRTPLVMLSRGEGLSPEDFARIPKDTNLCSRPDIGVRTPTRR